MAIQRLAYTANEIDEKLSLVPSLGITGAQPGDIIRVNQVDSEGRPVSLQGGGKWTLLEDLTLEEDTKQVDMAPEGMDQYERLLFAWDFNLTSGWSLGIYANNAAADAWWLHKLTYGHYLYRWGQIEFSRAPGIHGEAIKLFGSETYAANAHSDLRSPFHRAQNDGTLSISRYVQAAEDSSSTVYRTPPLPWSSIHITTCTDDHLIQAGGIFELYGWK